VASANYSVEMVAALNDIGGEWIVCKKRPFDVIEYTMTVPFPENAISAARHLALAQFKSGNTVLIFLPGKTEIESMSFSFEAAGLDKEQVLPFHRDLEEFELDKVRNPANYPRIILASSLAEVSVTLADVDLVIDLGLSRILLDEYEIIKVEDHASSDASKEQRRGRAGRVKKGSFVLLVVEESNLSPARFYLNDAFSRVHALSTFQEQIGLSNLSLCKVPEHLVEEAARFVSELNFSQYEMKLALTRFPLSLADARILFSGAWFGIGYETAFFVALKAKAKYSKSTKLDFSELMEMAHDSAILAKNSCPVSNMHRVMELSKELSWLLKAQPSEMNAFDIKRSLAAALLHKPERLLWQRIHSNEPACFLGAVVKGHDVDGYSVAALLIRAYVGLKCTLWLFFLI
jgi:hypothetical protein